MSELRDLSALIRANTPLIVIQTGDETRVVELFRQSLLQVWRALHRWTITEGLRRINLDARTNPKARPTPVRYCVPSMPPTSAGSICCSISTPIWATPAPTSAARHPPAPPLPAACDRAGRSQG